MLPSAASQPRESNLGTDRQDMSYVTYSGLKWVVFNLYSSDMIMSSLLFDIQAHLNSNVLPQSLSLSLLSSLSIKFM